MKLRLFSPTVAVLLCSASTLASVPSTQTAKQRLLLKLDALIQQPESGPDIVRTVSLLATPAQLQAVCDNPELSLVGRDSRLTGKRTVLAQCGPLPSRAPQCSGHVVDCQPESAGWGHCSAQRY